MKSIHRFEATAGLPCWCACWGWRRSLAPVRPRPSRREHQHLHGGDHRVSRLQRRRQPRTGARCRTGRGFGNESTRGGTPQVVRVLPPERLQDWRRSKPRCVPAVPGVRSRMPPGCRPRPTGARMSASRCRIWASTAPGLIGHGVSRARHLSASGSGHEPQCRGVNYTIKEMRSVKYNEKQYFDHPAFGVIAVVSPAPPAAGTATR